MADYSNIFKLSLPTVDPPEVPIQIQPASLLPTAASLAQLNQGMLSPSDTSGGLDGVGFLNWLNKDQNLRTTLGGLEALSNAYMGFQSLRTAKDNLNFQKKAYNTNLRNSTQSYNTQLADRINGRTADYAGKDADVAAYLAANSLKLPG